MPERDTGVGPVLTVIESGLPPKHRRGPVASGGDRAARRTVAGEARVTVSAVMREALVDGVTRLLRYDEGVRRGDDAEAIHDARVTTRRLRSDLGMLGTVIDTAWLATASRELEWLGRLLGAVRDADVLTERLQRQTYELTRDDQQAARPMFRLLALQRDEGRLALLEGLGNERYVALLGHLVEATVTVPVEPDDDRLAADTLPGLARKPWRRLRRAVASLDPQPSDAALHRVRIRAKRARYAAEVAVPIVGKPARRYATAMAGLQTVLGDHHDAVVAEEWLRRAGAHTAATALVAGQLIARQQVDAALTRRQWRDAWTRASAKKLRAWFD